MGLSARISASEAIGRAYASHAMGGKRENMDEAEYIRPSRRALKSPAIGRPSPISPPGPAEPTLGRLRPGLRSIAFVFEGHLHLGAIGFDFPIGKLHVEL